jgi:hypothetical protein
VQHRHRDRDTCIYVHMALPARAYLKPATLCCDCTRERSHLRERARALVWPVPARARALRKKIDRYLALRASMGMENLLRRRNIYGKRESEPRHTSSHTHMICASMHARTGQDHNCICSALLALDYYCYYCADEQRDGLYTPPRAQKGNFLRIVRMQSRHAIGSSLRA